MPAVVFHFGSEKRYLLGTFHHTPRLKRRGAAVLLCNPLGEEAARAHRTYRVLATLLERSGYAAQRFDYRGTGDSFGDCELLSIESSLDDIESAAAELCDRSGVGRVTLVGLRLGATLAALIPDVKRLRPRQLVLWDPIVNGAAYLRELSEAHRAYMTDEMGMAEWSDRRAVDGNGIPTEALGTPLTPALAAGIASLDLMKITPRADHVSVICTRATNELALLRERWSQKCSLRWLDLPESTAWNSDAALNSATVPIDILNAIVAQVEEASP